MHTGNPALSEKVVSGYLVAPREQVRTMTVAGTALKTFVLLVFLVAGGSWGWSSATRSIPVDIGGGYGNTTVTIPGGFWLASLAAFLVAMFVIFNPRRAALLGIAYALLEGYCLGAISAAFEAQTEGIVGAAVLATVCVFVVALFLYVTRIVRPTRRMALGVFAPVAPLQLTPKVPLEQGFIVAGTLDRFARPSSQAVALWRHWDQPAMHWYHGGHVSLFWARGLQPVIDAQLRAVGLARGEDGP